jgi:ketosteroid isomerase-like protein
MTNMTDTSPEENAQAVFDRFLTAFTAADVDAVVGIFWPDALF